MASTATHAAEYGTVLALMPTLEKDLRIPNLTTLQMRDNLARNSIHTGVRALVTHTVEPQLASSGNQLGEFVGVLDGNHRIVRSVNDKSRYLSPVNSS